VDDGDGVAWKCMGGIYGWKVYGLGDSGVSTLLFCIVLYLRCDVLAYFTVWVYIDIVHLLFCSAPSIVLF
jgi:hypothetical protein